MVKPILTICLWAVFFLLGAVRGWCDIDMENRFLGSDVLSANTNSKTVFLDVKNVSLIDILKTISQQSGLSFIAAHDVEDRRITVYINKVPLNQAMQMILDANDLTYQMQPDSNVFIVMKKYQTAKTLITKVFQLKYATVSTSLLNNTIADEPLAGSNQTPSTVSTPSMATSTTTGSAPTTAPSAGGQQNQPTAIGSGGGGAELSTGGMEEAVKDSLSRDGKIVEDSRTNSLIITDVPGQFPLIESTIARLDVPIPQILIEVIMLDVSKDVEDQLGITYGAQPFKFQGGAKKVDYPFSVDRSAAGSGIFTPGIYDSTGMTAAVNFLISNTDARTLAKPRILTLNNQTAQIEISTNQAVDVVPSSSSTGTAGSIAGFTVDRFTTGVVLKVTPQANLLTNEVTLAVSPKVVSVNLAEVTTPSGGRIFDPETRGSDSILKLKDGQSMVIGGLMDNQTTNVASKLPILGDLPVIGSAFRSTDKKVNQRELLIFLTPHIIHDPNEQKYPAENNSLTQDQATSDNQDVSAAPLAGSDDSVYNLNTK